MRNSLKVVKSFSLRNSLKVVTRFSIVLQLESIQDAMEPIFNF